MTLKFVVLSDLHLVRHGQTSMTLDTAERLAQADARYSTAVAGADLLFRAGHQHHRQLRHR